MYQVYSSTTAVARRSSKPPFSRSKLAMAVLSSALCTLPVLAQEAQQEPKEDKLVEEVVVTGYRQSVLNALDAKRLADTVTENISADDLGNLPDVSMADALTRLPGISAVRTGGQASEINIRGMAGGFVFSTLNGREQVSTSGQRNIEFEQYPSELISAASVYKSPKASLIEGGVAGTVELKTASPLDMSEDSKLAINLRGMMNDRADEVYDAQDVGHRFSISYQTKFADDTVGLGVGFARLYQPSVATQFVGFSYRNLDSGGRDVDGDGAADIMSYGFELQHRGGEETRDGLMGVLEWQPSDDLKVRADYYSSTFDTEAFARGFRFQNLFQGNITNPVMTADGVMVGGYVQRARDTDVLVQTTNDDNSDHDEVTSYGLNVEYLVGNWTLSGDISTSKAESNFVNGVGWGLLFEDASAAVPIVESDIAVNYKLNGVNLPDIGFNQDYTDLDKMMLAKWGVYPYINTDQVDAVKFDAAYEFTDNSVFSSFEAGVRSSKREYTNERGVYQFGNDFGYYAPGEAPLKLTSELATTVDFNGDFGYFPSYLAIDMDKALAQWLPAGEGTPVKSWADSWTMTQSGGVEETVNAAYLQLNIDTEIGGRTLLGNIGVRAVQTEQFSIGLRDVDGNVEAGAVAITDDLGEVSTEYALVGVGQKYTDYLPSINLNYLLTDNDQLRFAAAKVLSRPPIKRLQADESVNISDDGKFSASSNNSPLLDPFYANQYDLSYEHYFEDTSGAIVAAVFYKDILGFVNSITIDPYDFIGDPAYDVPTYVPGTEPGNANSYPPVNVVNGSLSTVINNTQGGYIQGIELAYTQTFDNLPGIWSGLGFSGSYSYTESNISFQTDLSGSSVDITLPGLSDTVYSASLFYDYDNFSTRVNIRNRSKFVSEQVAVETQLAFFNEETVIDYQASYNVNDNLQVLFQVNNFTDEPTKTYFNQEAQTGTLQFFGRQLFLGVSYSM